MTNLRDSPLGHATTYADAYDPRLLFAVDRAPQRDELGLGATLPFRGFDVWNAYELSWLDTPGKPQVGIATFSCPPTRRDRRVEIRQALPDRIHLTRFARRRESGHDRARPGRRDRRAGRCRARPAGRLRGAASRRSRRRGPRRSSHRVRGEPRRGAARGRGARSRPDAEHAPLPLAVPGHLPARLRLRADPLPRAAARSVACCAISSPFVAIPASTSTASNGSSPTCRPAMPPRGAIIYARFTRRGGVDINPVSHQRRSRRPPNHRTARQ